MAISIIRTAALGAFLLAAQTAGALAGELAVTVRDQRGEPAPHAVVYLLPSDGKVPSAKGKPAVVDQVNKEFIRSITAVQTGTAISFPNSDDIRHHVYSLSPAKTFELPLYIGTPAKPVLFDKPGMVVLGCNIHDWMIAYIYVVDTPWFALTGADGVARLADVPPGQYRLLAWHYRMKGDPAAFAEAVQMGEGKAALERELALKPEFTARRAPLLLPGGYR